MDCPQRPIFVLGCGVIGLTTAIRIQESRRLGGTDAPGAVRILASHLPSDALSPAYASSAAGAHHLSFASDDDVEQRVLDARTFDVMWAELEAARRGVGQPDPDSLDNDSGGDGGGGGEGRLGLMKVVQTEFFDGDERHLDFFEGMPDFRVVGDIPPRLGEATHCVEFTSFTMTPDIYLRRLYDRFISNGGIVHRVHISHLSQAVHHVPDVTPRALVVCLGLGARSVGGLADDDMFPTRGQVVVLDAPWCRQGFTFQQGKLKGGEGGRRSYIIPRSNGEVIVGGTRDVDDWNGNPRSETTTRILEGVLALGGPALFPPGTSDPDHNVERLRRMVKSEVVGWRPTRKTGVRIERLAPVKSDTDVTVAVVANYGHGGFGWQSCWASAERALSILGGEEPPGVSSDRRRCVDNTQRL